METISEARLSNVFPLLATKIRDLAIACESEGIEIRVTQALRTVAEQDALFAKGRSVLSDIACNHDGDLRPPGSCREHPLGAIVTNCRGGHSWHNYGAAVDVVPSTHGPGQPYDPDWHDEHPTWKRMEKLGQELGLASGAAWRSFPDAPHFELVGRFPISPDDEVRGIYAAAKPNGLAAVWAAIDQSLGAH